MVANEFIEYVHVYFEVKAPLMTFYTIDENVPPAFLKSFCLNDNRVWRHMMAWRHAATSYDVLKSRYRPDFFIMTFKSETSQ